MIQLSDYLNDKDELVVQAAELLVKAEYSYDNGKLTYSEYQEIISDVLDIESLGDLSEHLERKQRIQQIFEVLRELMGAITLL